MIITKKHLPRRTFLRGMGVTLALPLLDGMVPALSALGKTAAKAVPRLGVIYAPNGILMNSWTPSAEGTAFELTPTLQALAPYRNQLLVLSGLNSRPADALGDGAGDHTRASAAFLTGVHPKKTEGADLQAGVSMDQIAAKAIGNQTQLGSLELSAESMELMGTCDTGYSCTYQTTIAWRTPTTPLPMESNPRAVFERLFGDGVSTDPAVRQAQIKQNTSILDFVTQKVAGLEKQLGPRDRSKLIEYLDAIRDVERRIQKAEEQSARELPLVNRPNGIPGSFEEHIKLLFDLQVLAFQCDLTRVVTFMLAKESSETVYPASGVSEPHHPLTHHGGDPEKMAKVAKINAYHVKMFAYLLEKLRAVPDGDSTLLDQSMIMYGSGIGNGNLHSHNDLPMLVVGGGAGRLQGGRHLRYSPDTPLSNLHLTLLDKLGVPAERFGDSTGALNTEVAPLSGI